MSSQCQSVGALSSVNLNVISDLPSKWFIQLLPPSPLTALVISGCCLRFDKYCQLLPDLTFVLDWALHPRKAAQISRRDNKSSVKFVCQKKIKMNKSAETKTTAAYKLYRPLQIFIFHKASFSETFRRQGKFILLRDPLRQKKKKKKGKRCQSISWFFGISEPSVHTLLPEKRPRRSTVTQTTYSSSLFIQTGTLKAARSSIDIEQQR